MAINIAINFSLTTSVFDDFSLCVAQYSVLSYPFDDKEIISSLFVGLKLLELQNDPNLKPLMHFRLLNQKSRCTEITEVSRLLLRNNVEKYLSELTNCPEFNIGIIEIVLNYFCYIFSANQFETAALLSQ